MPSMRLNYFGSFFATMDKAGKMANTVASKVQAVANSARIQVG